MLLRKFKTYYISVILNLCFFILVSLFPENGNSQTILISSGVPSNGSGDVAANVLMAQFLKKANPDSQIVVYVTPESIEILSSLIPDVKNYPIDQVNFSKNGILYISPGEFISHESQMPIFHFSFSNPHGFPPKSYFKAKQKVPRPFSFSEYEGKYLNGKMSQPVYRLKNTSILTTGLRFAGIYISGNGGSISLDNDFASLESQELSSIQEAMKSKYIVYLYSRNNNLVSAYIQEILKTIKGDTITIFATPSLINHLEWGGEINLNDKIRLVSNSVSFEMTKAMMQVSNLPLIVTGDVSLSLAIEYRKPFIYSVYSWKDHFARDLEILFPTALVAFEDHRNYFKQFNLEKYGDSFYTLFDVHRSSLSLPDKIKKVNFDDSRRNILRTMRGRKSPFMATNDLNQLFDVQSGRDKYRTELVQ